MPVIFGCKHYQVNYTVYHYVRGTQSWKAKKCDCIRKVVSTTYVPVKPSCSKRSKIKVILESNDVFPGDFQEYCRIDAYL
ncbi:Ff.00g003520.m01.CDS01 [Fusarium sp. VM40]|nr:Ff.00g003520.m01.CDS01 [Fusarium sp. VM40]